jgi:translation elongation factor EF-Tu-like GTPase
LLELVEMEIRDLLSMNMMEIIPVEGSALGGLNNDQHGLKNQF